jgi:hypothetical protein
MTKQERLYGIRRQLNLLGYRADGLNPGCCRNALEVRPERPFRENRALETKGLRFQKPPKTPFPDAPLVAKIERLHILYALVLAS